MIYRGDAVVNKDVKLTQTQNFLKVGECDPEKLRWLVRVEVSQY